MIAIDLGTTNIRIYLKGKGIILREPAVIAVLKDTTDIKAVGNDAYQMLGRTPGNISAIRPMSDGVIADYSLTEKMLRAFVQKVLTGPRKFLKPNMMICIPSYTTDVEKRAVLQAANEIGARKALLIEEPIAAAIGAGINITKPVGTMIIDIGGGTTDIAVISLGGIVVSESIRVAGNTFDSDIARYLRKHNNILIGNRTAEEIKCTIGSAVSDTSFEDKSMTIKGRSLINGLPLSTEVFSSDISTALKGSLDKISYGVLKVLERTPLELISDIIERGIILTGGGAKLNNMDAFISKLTNIPVSVAENPEDCVIIGTGKALEMIQNIQVASKASYR